MGSYRIPFNKPAVVGKELQYVEDAARQGHLAGDGPFTQRCHHFLEQWLGVPRALLTTSCTHALELASLLMDLRPDDEVVVPSFTFVSTVNPFVLRGARPVFADIRPDTLNLDEERLESLVTSRTRAVVVVHYAGVGAEMDRILDIARRYRIVVVEDNAHGLFGRYRGRPLGTLTPLATLSFHATKNISCGEGGALLINDLTYAERAEILREKGTNRTRFMRGEVDKYTWVDVGSSYLPSDLLAGFLYGQLEAWEAIQARRRRVWEYYREHLQALVDEHGVQLPTIPGHCEQPFHMFYVLLRSEAQRRAVIADLRARGILAVFHYSPLHLSEMGARFGGKTGDCPVTEDVSRRLLRLPFYNDLEEAAQADVVTAFVDSVRRHR